MADKYDLKALKLKSGGIYAIECSRNLSLSEVMSLQRALESESDRLGVKLFLLGKEFRIARAGSAIRKKSNVS